MLVLKTGVKTQSEEFLSNYKHNKSLTKNIQDITHEVQTKRDEKVLSQHKKRGKLLARERIELLVDKKSKFLEFSPLAAYEKYNNHFPGAGIITGLGIIN